MEKVHDRVARKEGPLIQTREHISTLQKSGIILEIYPRSFRSGRGGSQGDIKGIIEKLDYLDWLGVQNIWLPPIYPSPMRDGGYDVTNYCGIHSDFGNLQEFDELVSEADKHGIGIIMDLVVNHTSDQHEWFKEAMISSGSPFRDRYVFAQGKTDGRPPNNQLSVFGGSAWELVSDEKNTYYYHTFAKEQPDLNYNHPAVPAEMKRAMRFWLDRGVKGIRVDAVHFVGKNTHMDEPENPEWDGENTYLRLNHPYTQFQPGMFDFMGSLCEVAASYGDRVVIFEAAPLEAGDLNVYYRIYDSLNRHVGAPFHFGLLFAEWTATGIKSHVEEFLAGLAHDAVPVWNVSNHDQPRVASRVGEGQARVAMALILTLPGVPTLYYGDEIGMVNGQIDNTHKRDDPRTTAFPRDIVRTPMQWSSDDATGFTSPGIAPWIKPNCDIKTRNVEDQKKDRSSILNFTRNLIELRRRHPVLELGEYMPIENTADGVYMFGRQLEDKSVTVVLNFTNQEKTVEIPQQTPKLMFSMRRKINLTSGIVKLYPNEVMLLKS